MKLDKSLISDCQETDQPEGSYRFAKNILDSNVMGAKENEPGFTSLGIVAPYTIIGVIPTGESFVVFSTNNTNSEIGFWDGSYSMVYNSSGLGFDTAFPIKGEYKLNYKNEIIVSWIDKKNPPRTINIDTPNISTTDDLLVFPKSTPPALTFTVNDFGGTLATGTYIPITRYTDLSGATSAWYLHNLPVYITDDLSTETIDQRDGALPGSGSSKSITLNFTELDTAFSKLEVGYISVINSIVKAASIREVTFSGPVSYTITGSETTSELTIDEVLTSPASYSNARAITQLNSRLFLGNLSSDDNIDFQQYANQIKINYTSTLVTAATVSKNNESPGFRAGEVYAFYIVLELASGKELAYHIPGRPFTGAEKNTIVDATSGLTYTKFRVENTSDSGALTNMGFWENLGETYSPTFPVGISNIGGVEVLANQNVRHHRFPTMDALIASSYPSNGNVGISLLPKLGINVTNVNIPADIKAKIVRWKIAFAKKNYDNSLIIGQDILQFGGHKLNEINTRWSTAGNWDVKAVQASNDDGGWDDIILMRDKFRSHCLDLQFDRPAVIPSYIHLLYSLNTINLNVDYTGFNNTSGGKLTTSGQNRGQCPGVVSNFTNTGQTSRTLLGAARRRRVDNFVYIDQNSSQDIVATLNTEGIISGDIFNPGALIPEFPVNNPQFFTNSSSEPPSNRGAGEPIMYKTAGYDDAECTYVYNMCQILNNVHSGFGSQTLIPTDKGQKILFLTSLSDIYGGDTFPCLQEYMSAAPMNANKTFNIPYQGIRAFKVWFGEARNNWGLRHEGIGIQGKYVPKTNPQTLWYPPCDPGNLTDRGTYLDASQVKFNDINYNKDYSVHNEYIPIAVIDDPTKFIAEFPTTIIFSTVQGTESTDNSWRTFLANDRYTQPKNKGAITNLQGINNQDLLIHHRYSLFKTRTNVGLEGDTLDVTLSSSELFTIPPTEILSTESGYGGTQHSLSCKLTKAGYFFVDNLQGKAFLYTEQLNEISSNGTRIFFRDFMGAPDNDSPYTLSGYNAAYDEKYNRLLMSKKDGANSWTISYSPTKQGWISYHDYVPDYIFTLVNSRLYSFSGNVLYQHNIGEFGTYYEGVTYPSIIDVVYNPAPAKDKLFSGIEWTTESYDSSGVLQVDDTIDYITIRNLDKCSGKVPVVRLDSVYAFYSQNTRVINRSWFFNAFRDIAKQPGFTLGFYSNFNLDATKLNSNTAWYNQQKFIDKFVTCRFEYSNSDNNRLLLLDNTVDFRPTAR